MILLKQSTASQEIPLGPFLDDTDGKTAETGLTIANTDIKIWKSGQTSLANKNSGGATHMANGVYYATLDATDSNTAGPMKIFVDVAGALPVVVECWVMVANVYDSLVGGSANLNVNLAEVLTSGTAATNIKNDYDGTGYNKSNSTIGTCTTNTDMITTAEVNTEVDNAIVTYGLDHLVSAAVIGTDVADNSIMARIVSSAATADWDTFVNTTDSLQATRDHIGDGTNLTEAGGTGDHLTALATQTSVNTIDTNVDAIKAKTDSLTFTVANQVDANALQIESVDATDQINAACDTALSDMFTSSAQLVDDIWDEPLAGHTTANTTGKSIKELKEGIISAEGTVNDVSATTTTFITDLTEASDDHYNELNIAFTSGNLAGQARVILDYNGTSKTITLDEALTEAPANTDSFIILSAHVHTKSVIADAIWDEVLTGATHNVTNSAGRRLRSIGDFGQYVGGYVWIDTVNGTAGTTNFENGTITNPVDSIADAITLAASVGLRGFSFYPGSSITLAASVDNYIFTGSGYTVALGGQSVSGCLFENATITGNDDGSNATATSYYNCVMGTNTLGLHSLKQCGLSGTITLAEAGTIDWQFCSSQVAGTSSPTVDMGALVLNTNLNIRHYSGGIEIQNMGGAGTDNCTVEGNGQVTLNANCTGGTLAVRGNIKLNDNSSGAVSIVPTIPNIDQVHQGAAQAGTANTITLDAGASATNGYYDPGLVIIYAGTGTGQARSIIDYNGTTKVATVDKDWRTNPDSTSQFIVKINPGQLHVNEGMAQGGGASTITLNTAASATDDIYIGQTVFCVGGTGQDQARIVTDYNGTTKVATVHKAWDTQPDSTTSYVMLPLPVIGDYINDILTDTGTTLPGTLTTIEGKIDTVDTNVDSVLVDTGTTLPGTLTTMDGKLDTIDTNVDAVLVDTGTTLPSTLSDIQGATFNTATDSLEALRDRGDTAWTTGAGGNPPELLQTTTIATLASQTSFTLTAGSADDDAYNNALIIITDQSTSTQKAVGKIENYTGGTLTVTLKADPGVFTMAVGDTVDIIASPDMSAIENNTALIPGLL